jgi:hypothetical protein
MCAHFFGSCRIMEEEEEGKPTTSRRSRRSTQFRDDFRFKDFSDLDSDEDAKKRPPSNKASRNRTKTCPGCDAQLNTSVKECTYCDYTFTAKTIQVNQMSAADESKFIRSRFPFEPEREEDGSMKIESIFGRRLHSSDRRKHSCTCCCCCCKPILNTTQHPYTLHMLCFCCAVLCCVVLCCVAVHHTVVRGRSSVASATDSKFEHEYLVKFKTMSYVHVQWLTAQEIGMKYERRCAACLPACIYIRILSVGLVKSQSTTIITWH